MTTGSVVTFFVLAYLVGSIPTGTIAARLAGKGSLLVPGERSTLRAREVFEVLGMGLGITVTIIDILKGVAVVWPLRAWLVGPLPTDPGLVGPLAAPPWWAVCGGALLVVIGHCNSALLGFRGGRGLATTFGVMLVLLPVPAILAFVLWGGLSFWGLSTRPGALLAAGAMPLLSIPYIWWFHADQLEYLFLVAFLSVWTIWEYRAAMISYFYPSTPPPPQGISSPHSAETAPPDGPTR